MRLHVEVFYPQLTLEACYRLHLSEHYQNSVAQQAGTLRTGQVYQPLRGGGLYRQAQFAYRRPVEGGLQRLLREITPAFSHVETSVYYGPLGGSWSILGGATLFPQCVSGHGVLRFYQERRGVRRVVDGNIDCSLWGVRHFAEQQIVAKTAQSLQMAAAYTPAYVRQFGVPAQRLTLTDAAHLGALLGTAPRAAPQKR